MVKQKRLALTNGQTVNVTSPYPIKASTDLERNETIFIVKGLPLSQEKSGDKSCN